MTSPDPSFLSEWFSTVQILLNRCSDKETKASLTTTLCRNPLLTWELIQAHPEIPWDYATLSKHPAITPAIVKENPSIPWDPVELCKNPNFHWENLKPLIPDITSDVGLAQNPNLSWEHAMEFMRTDYSPAVCARKRRLFKPMPEYGSDLEMPVRSDVHLSYEWFQKPFVTLEFLQKWRTFLTGRPNSNLNWYSYWNEISANPNITWEIVQANPDFPWSASGLSRNPNITAEILFANPEFNWQPGEWQAFPSIPPEKVLEFVRTHRQGTFTYMWRAFAKNSLLTTAFVKEHWDFMENDVRKYLLNKQLSAKTLSEIYALRNEDNSPADIYSHSPNAPLSILKDIVASQHPSTHFTVFRFLSNPLTAAAAEHARRNERKTCLLVLWRIPWLPEDIIRYTTDFL